MLNRGRAVILGGRAEMVTSPRIQAGLARPLRGEEGGADGWARLAARGRGDAGLGAGRAGRARAGAEALGPVAGSARGCSG